MGGMGRRRRADRVILDAAEAALRARVDAVRGAPATGYEAGPRWRALHGDYREEVEHAGPGRAGPYRYSTDPGPVSSRRRRYGGLERLKLDPETRAAAERLIALHEAAQRLSAVRGCLAEAKRGGEDHSDATRAALVRNADKWRRAAAALGCVQQRLGGMLVSEREVVLRVAIGGAALSRCHLGAKALSGAALVAAKRLLCAGVHRGLAAADGLDSA